MQIDADVDRTRHQFEDLLRVQFTIAAKFADTRLFGDVVVYCEDKVESPWVPLFSCGHVAPGVGGYHSYFIFHFSCFGLELCHSSRWTSLVRWVNLKVDLVEAHMIQHGDRLPEVNLYAC